MASVLVIAVDPNIESLVGELVALAGHRPFLDSTLGAAGESVRRMRPDVCLLDDALPQPVLEHCLNASDEVGAQPVLISHTVEGEERAFRSFHRLLGHRGYDLVLYDIVKLVGVSPVPPRVGI